MSFLRRTNWLPVIPTLVFLGLLVNHAQRGATFIGAAYFNDDTFYYLQSVRNLVELGFLTFDGVNPTNGVHFLWTLVLTLPAYWITDPDGLVVAVFWLNGLLIVLAAWGAGRLVPLGSAGPMLVHSGLYLVALARLPYLLAGMETGVLLVVLVWFLHSARRLHAKIETPPNEPGQINHVVLWSYALAGVLVIWARLDYAAVVGLVTLGLGIATTGGIRRLVCIARAQANLILLILVTGIIALTVPLLANYYWNETWIPISGTIKLAGTRPLLPHLQMAAYALFPLPEVPLAYAIPGAVLFVVQTAAITVLVVRRRTFFPLNFKSSAYLVMLMLLGWATIGYALIAGTSLQPYFRWYLASTYLFWALSLPGWLWLAQSTWNRFRRSKREEVSGVVPLHELARNYSLSAAIVLSFAALAITGSLILPTSSFYRGRIQAARAIGAALPTHCVLAAWNAGALGYFTPQRLVNLDGLVNSRAYRDNYLGRPERFTAYLEAQDIDFVVDYQFYWATDIITEFPSEAEYSLNDRVVLHMRRTPNHDCT